MAAFGTKRAPSETDEERLFSSRVGGYGSRSLRGRRDRNCEVQSAEFGIVMFMNAISAIMFIMVMLH